VEKEDGVMVIRRVHVLYTLKVADDKRATAERVHELHHDRCPVYRTVAGCVDVTTELRMLPLAGG